MGFGGPSFATESWLRGELKKANDKLAEVEARNRVLLDAEIERAKPADVRALAESVREQVLKPEVSARRFAVLGSVENDESHANMEVLGDEFDHAPSDEEVAERLAAAQENLEEWDADAGEEDVRYFAQEVVELVSVRRMDFAAKSGFAFKVEFTFPGPEGVIASKFKATSTFKDYSSAARAIRRATLEALSEDVGLSGVDVHVFNNEGVEVTDSQAFEEDAKAVWRDVEYLRALFSVKADARRPRLPILFVPNSGWVFVDERLREARPVLPADLAAAGFAGAVSWAYVLEHRKQWR